jgi:hypothetical protein
MSQRDILRHEDRVSEISRELGRHLTQQTEFFRKGTRVGHTPEELREYKESRDRVRELFAELERIRKAVV